MKCWLFNAPGVSACQVCEDSIRSMFTARSDLAACLLARLAGDRHDPKTIGGGHDRGHARHPPVDTAGRNAGNRKRDDPPIARGSTLAAAPVLGQVTPASSP
jgi:hypothetical protein